VDGGQSYFATRSQMQSEHKGTVGQAICCGELPTRPVATRQTLPDAGCWKSNLNDQYPRVQRKGVMLMQSDPQQAAIDNRADQLNPNNDAYWQSRG